MVWISTGNSSGVAFNALKKNAIQVYPLSAKQYVDGAWVDVTAMSYQGGEWVEWWDHCLYKEGNEYETITGGWGSTFNVTDWNNTNVSEEAATKNEKSITIKASSEYTASIINTKKAIDATPYKTLTVDIDVKSGIVDVLLTNTLSGSYTSKLLSWVVAGKQNLDEGRQTVTVDLSGVNGNVYIVILGIKGISSDQTAEATITIVTLR